MHRFTQTGIAAITATPVAGEATGVEWLLLNHIEFCCGAEKN
jgi:hypothetical protein